MMGRSCATQAVVVGYRRVVGNGSADGWCWHEQFEVRP